MKKILVTGAGGRLGTALTETLRQQYGRPNVIASDLYAIKGITAATSCHYLDVLDKTALLSTVKKENITEICHLAGLLTGQAEKDPERAWELNVNGLLNVLEVAKSQQLKVFWPSSIAVFGREAPRLNCPQYSVTQPVTAYGMTKVAGENWCRYYAEKHGLDIRSLRLPAVIIPGAEARGGIMDYLSAMFKGALSKRQYTCYLKPHIALPSVYIDDVARAVIQLMEAEKGKIVSGMAYNIQGQSTTPAQMEAALKTILPSFTMDCRPDQRQLVAETWPSSLDDSLARQHWGWQPQYDLKAINMLMVNAMEMVRESWT